MYGVYKALSSVLRTENNPPLKEVSCSSFLLLLFLLHYMHLELAFTFRYLISNIKPKNYYIVPILNFK